MPREPRPFKMMAKTMLFVHIDFYSHCAFAWTVNTEQSLVYPRIRIGVGICADKTAPDCSRPFCAVSINTHQWASNAGFEVSGPSGFFPPCPLVSTNKPSSRVFSPLLFSGRMREENMLNLGRRCWLKDRSRKRSHRPYFILYVRELHHIYFIIIMSLIEIYDMIPPS